MQDREKWHYDPMVIEQEKQKATAHRQRLNKIYSTALPTTIQLDEKYQNWRFNIIVENKDEILKALFDAGLFASNHYKPQTTDCPNAQYLYEHVINLFNDFYYTEEQARKTCEIINRMV